MLMFTALSWALFGVAAAVAHDGAMPAYLINVAAPFSALTVFDSDAVPAVLSHFLGDSSVAYSDAADKALRLIPSTFMDDRNAGVLVVDNFNISEAESQLGSPHFYLSQDAIADVTAASLPAHVESVAALHSAEYPNIRVDPAGEGLCLDDVLSNLKHVRNAKVMLIGLPSRKSDSTGRVVQRGSLMESVYAVQNKSYINIPAFFDSAEDCEAITGSCSGRGSCTKASNGKYACKCQATKSDGRTHYWGGNDCSKHDVSFQANLIVGTTIAILVASTLSIGLLFKLGSEPLPGILTTTGIQG